MRVTVANSVTWLVAISAVASLYAPSIFGLPSSRTTPLFAAVIAVALMIPAFRRFPSLPVARAPWPMRTLSVCCLAVAVSAFAAVTAIGAVQQTYGLNDWGLLGIQAGIPILIALNDKRVQILAATGWVCVCFAVIDLLLNLVSVAQGQWFRDAGLSGNTHAAGLVAFMAVAFLCATRRHPFYWALIVALLLSLCVIDARRYLGMALVAVALLAYRPASKIPLAVVSAIAAGVGLYGTFSNGSLSFGDNLRASLMERGLTEALSRPFLGAGPHWRDTSGLEATYQSLTGAGVTESGVLDLSIAYGLPATVVFVSAAILALAARRKRTTLPAVMLSMLTAELAFGNSLTGFLGALIYFTSLTICQRDEIRLLAAG